MAEVLQKEHKQKAGVRRTKKPVLRVDLTPMVDLGFLLISFFVFTTTIAQPKAMKLVLPDDSRNVEPLKAGENKTLNLLLSAGNKVYAYNGSNLNSIKEIGSDSKAIRTIIFAKKKAIGNKYGSDSGMVVLIKPTNESTYEDVVDMLDEMLICNVKTYVLMDADSNETAAIKLK